MVEKHFKQHFKFQNLSQSSKFDLTTLKKLSSNNMVLRATCFLLKHLSILVSKSVFLNNSKKNIYLKEIWETKVCYLYLQMWHYKYNNLDSRPGADYSDCSISASKF